MSGPLALSYFWGFAPSFRANGLVIYLAQANGLGGSCRRKPRANGPAVCIPFWIAKWRRESLAKDLPESSVVADGANEISFALYQTR